PSKAFGGLPRYCSSTGSTATVRRSCVAARFIAPVSDASVCTFWRATAFRSSCTRCTGPNDQLSSEDEKPSAGLLFQLRITPGFGSIPRACLLNGKNPRHSNSPVPLVGSPLPTLG